jgi:hypothetical protein
LYSKIADVDESFGELVLNSESYLQISPEKIKSGNVFIVGRFWELMHFGSPPPNTKYREKGAKSQNVESFFKKIEARFTCISMKCIEIARRKV